MENENGPEIQLKHTFSTNIFWQVLSINRLSILPNYIHCWSSIGKPHTSNFHIIGKEITE